jgi:hypothetical protein
MVQRWVARAQGKRLDRVVWADQPHGRPQGANRTSAAMEALVLQTRLELRQESALGEFGAVAVRRTLHQQGVGSLPSIRTIGRIFDRRGHVDGHGRIRRSAPPVGWYLPALAAGQVELDQVDLVEGLKIKDGPLVEVLNLVSLHGGLVASWPQAAALTSRAVQRALIAHWRSWGLPDYVQFDNDTLFQGPHHLPDVIGRVMRLCLSLGVVPVFAPPRETGFQASIENYNGLWQAKVWSRFEHASLAALQERSTQYVTAHRRRTKTRREAAPTRLPFPKGWRLDLQTHPQGQLIFIRRTNPTGEVTLLGRTFLVDPHWVGRLVRCDVLLHKGKIRFFQLRRRAPQEQPLLNEVAYQLPKRPFHE